MTSISQLPAATALGADDAIPVQQTIDGVTRYATPAQIASGAGMLVAASNLADVPNEQAARNNLGLGTVAVLGIGSGLAAGGGNLAVEFGTQTGTVADGGVLAATTETASAAMPSTVTALEALFLQWIETNPAAFGIAYGTWLDSLPTSPNISGPPIWWSNTGTPTYS